jgi:hypothetical protein
MVAKDTAPAVTRHPGIAKEVIEDVSSRNAPVHLQER